MTLPRPDDPRFWPRKGFVCPPYPYGEYDQSRVVIMPVPYDSTTTARAGARDGPEAIITNSEDMELYDVGIGFEPYLHGIFTSPAVAVTNRIRCIRDRIPGTRRSASRSEIAASPIGSRLPSPATGGSYAAKVGQHRQGLGPGIRWSSSERSERTVETTGGRTATGRSPPRP